MTVVLSGLSERQRQSWRGLLDVAADFPDRWCLVGGQMVHLYCQERGLSPSRPTNDGDVVLDVRAQPNVLRDFTGALTAVGFTSAGSTPDGHQHRWVRDKATIDVLIPQSIGLAAASRKGITGGTTLATPGAQQAITRSELVPVQVDDKVATIRRPNLLGALVAKAAAFSVPKRSGQGASPHGLRHAGGDGTGMRSNRRAAYRPRPPLPRPDAHDPREVSATLGLHRWRRARHPRSRCPHGSRVPADRRRSPVAPHNAGTAGSGLVAVSELTSPDLAQVN